jgi:hypothetical protein
MHEWKKYVYDIEIFVIWRGLIRFALGCSDVERVEEYSSE